MAEQEKILAHLDNVFSHFEANLNGLAGKPLHDLQRRSFDALQQVQFPDRKHEDWKYTSVQKLVAPLYQLPTQTPDYAIPSIDGLDSYIIPVVNGKVIFHQIPEALQQQGVNVIPLHEALQDPSWKSVFSKWIFSENISSHRAFELLNFTFQSNGFFLDIPKNLKIDKPIEIRILHTDPGVTFSHPLYFIRANAGSNARIFERYETNILGKLSTAESLINTVGYIHVDPNASVIHTKWQNLPETQNLVYKLFITQYRDSRFETFAFDFGGNLVRNNVEVELEEHNTYTALQAGYLASGKQSMDHQTRINHKVAYCESHELYKGIIDGQSTAAFNGKVFVHPDAQKTNAFQQNDTLVLSQHALMNSKPQLEIYADDVKCSHGATIGQMDEKSLFYLKSRGIDANTAKHMLKRAFIAEVLDKVPDENIRNYIGSQMVIEE